MEYVLCVKNSGIIFLGFVFSALICGIFVSMNSGL